VTLFHPSSGAAAVTEPGRAAELPAQARASADFYAQNLLAYGGQLYGTGAPGLFTTYGSNKAEPIADDFSGYIVGMLRGAAPVAAVEGFRTRVLSEATFVYQRLINGRPGDMFTSANLDRLQHPWAGGTTGDLITRMLLHADFGGASYVYRGATDLILLRPDWVDIVLTERFESIGGVERQVGWERLGYAYWEGGRQLGADPVVLMPDEVCMFSPWPDPLASWRGMSWLTPLVREVQADKQATRHKQAFLDNAATPNIAVSLRDATTPKQFNEFVQAMDEAHKGSDNAGRTLYLGGGADVTVIGKDMKELDFGSIIGKGETRIANAAGVHPVVVGFSEGMQGSSLNAGNYGAAKRMTVDGTLRPTWRNLAGSLEVLFPPPAAPRGAGSFTPARLWMDTRDVAFLRDDEMDAAKVNQTDAQTMRTLLDAGFTAESIKAAMTAGGDWSLLVHSGLFSVQLQPPGTTAKPDTAPQPAPAGT
jgi:hypothetical protein